MKLIRKPKHSRHVLLRRISKLADEILFGTLSETYRTCGHAGCRCHRGEKHGPHLYVSFRGPEGRTQGFYVPQELAPAMRRGVAAWQELQALLRELAELNRQRLWATRTGQAGGRRSRRGKHGSSRARAEESV